MQMTHESRQATRVDIWVGARLRQRRLELAMSQEELADILGITFQQVQKYEKGANRIAASRLFDLAAALDMPIEYFFDGLVTSVGRKSGGPKRHVAAKTKTRR
jgi:transcriptional regulator with XRE-family HTH domain